MGIFVSPPPQKQKLSGEWDASDDGIDRISNLEDNILHYILSFLPTKDAIRTSILSRKWLYRWTSISDIDLVEGGDSSLFLEFVERALLLHDASDIKRLSLNFSVPVTSSRLNSWISNAMRHNLQALELSLPYETTFVFSCFLFTCGSLQMLKLEAVSALNLPTFIHFSHLKTLQLYMVTFVDDESTERLFSGCPVLEELELVNCGWKNMRNIKITSPTLKKLKIDHDSFWEDVLSCVINIYAESLISLICYTYLRVDFQLHELRSLVMAFIDSISTSFPRDVAGRRVFNLVASAYNVESLTIVEGSLDSLADSENLLDHLPTFHNLTELIMNWEFYGCKSSCRAFMGFLAKLPKLEYISFAEGFCKNSPFEESYFLGRVPSCIENSLETCVISRFRGNPAELHMLRYLLKNAKKLETITLYIDPSDKMLEEKLNNQLEMLPKGPENCCIELL